MTTKKSPAAKSKAPTKKAAAKKTAAKSPAKKATKKALVKAPSKKRAAPSKKAAAKKTTAKAPARKTPAKKVTPAVKAAVTPAPQPVALPALGTPVDAATLPGATERGASIAGKRFSFQIKTPSKPDTTIVWRFHPKRSMKENDWGWRQCGAAVVFEDNTTRYVGRFEGGVLCGTGSDTSGATWTWEATLASGKTPDKLCFYLPL